MRRLPNPRSRRPRIWSKSRPTPDTLRPIASLPRSLPDLFVLSPLLDLVRDQRSDVGPAELLDGADAGRRCDVDLRQPSIDHVDPREQKTADAKRRTQPLADLALPSRQVSGCGG